MIKLNIGDRIRLVRKSAGLTQKELGEKLGVSEKTVSSWEINRTEPSMGMLEKISNVLTITEYCTELNPYIPNTITFYPQKIKARTELDSITAELSETQVEKLIKFAKLIQRGEI